MAATVNTPRGYEPQSAVQTPFYRLPDDEGRLLDEALRETTGYEPQFPLEGATTYNEIFDKSGGVLLAFLCEHEPWTAGFTLRLYSKPDPWRMDMHYWGCDRGKMKCGCCFARKEMFNPLILRDLSRCMADESCVDVHV